MNVGFVKRLFFYRDLPGINDISKELNYFSHFGITADDAVEMLTLLKENENDIIEFRKKIFEKILYQIDYYSTHYIDKDNIFVKENDEKNIPSVRAFFSAHLYYGIRILAQEHWYIRNIVKTSFDPIVTIPTFGKNKYTYTDYLESIKFFYKEISYFHMMTIDKSEEWFSFYLEHDKYVNDGTFDLKRYKRLFMLIWIHAYSLISENILLAGLEYESENPKIPYFRPNLLNPIDIALVDEDIDITEDIRKRREKDLRIRESYEIKRHVKEVFEQANDKIMLYEKLPYSIKDFVIVINCMADVVEFRSTFEFDDFITILKGRVNSTIKDKDIPTEILTGFVKRMIITEKDLEVKQELHTIVRPLIYFEVNNKKYIHCEFEILYFTCTLLELYKFIEPEILKDFYNIYFPLMNKIATRETIVATRKFKVKWFSLRKHYFWLEKKKIYTKFFNLVDDIIYFPDTKMIVFLYWCNVMPRPKSWGLYNEDFQLLVGKNALARQIVKNKVSLMEMSFEHIKKIFGIKENVSSKTVILFDGTISVEARQIVENHVVNLCPIKCIADFFVNDVYKK